MAAVVGQGSFTVAAEGLGECGVAELVVGDGAEDEPVVPFAAGLLEGLEGCGQFAGSAGGFGGGLSDVAGQLGGLADGMELVGIVRQGFGGDVLRKPVLGENAKFGGKKSSGFGRVEGFKEGLKGSGEFGLVLVEDANQIDLGLSALMLEGPAELVGCFFCGGCGFLFDEVDLHIDVADVSCGSAEFFQEASSLFFRLPVWWQAGQQGEECELGFDAASAGAELVDRLWAGVGEADCDGGLEVCDLLSQGLDWAG